MKNILIICTGNICRSPMAEALFQELLQEKKIHISSAGISALVGFPPPIYAQEIMYEKKKIDISGHRARQATRDMFIKADLILVMDSHQKTKIEVDLPAVCGRVLRVGQWRDSSIPDPYRRSKKVFEQTFLLLDECLKDWSSRL